MDPNFLASSDTRNLNRCASLLLQHSYVGHYNLSLLDIITQSLQ